MVLSAAFTFALLGFLVMHYQLVAANCTTIEMYEKERMKPWPYDKGTRRNFEDVMGKR
jgi:palmitoyltransferase